jgi:NTP pyrophosphatase (non-canonical NTP hydrolase)
MVITFNLVETRPMISSTTIKVIAQAIENQKEQKLVNDYLNYYALPATPGMYANPPITLCAIVRLLGKIGHKYEVSTDYGRKPENALKHTPSDYNEIYRELGDIQFLLYRLAELHGINLHSAFFEVVLEWEQRMGMLHSRL